MSWGMPVRRVFLHVLLKEQRLASAVHKSEVLDRSSGAIAHLEAELTAGLGKAAHSSAERTQFAHQLLDIVVRQQHDRVGVLLKLWLPAAGLRICEPDPRVFHSAAEP